VKDLRNGKKLIIFSQDGHRDVSMKSGNPWVNLFHAPPDQAKERNKKSQGNPEMQSKSCRNDGRLMPWGSTDSAAESNFI
jgi:hypothetical protein